MRSMRVLMWVSSFYQRNLQSKQSAGSMTLSLETCDDDDDDDWPVLLSPQDRSNLTKTSLKNMVTDSIQ